MVTVIEFIHALSMVVWIALIPFLFYHRWPKITLLSVLYSITFIVVNRLSHWILGECIFTRMARWAGGEWNNECFTVKLTRIVFGFIPTNKSVTYVEQSVLMLVCIGILIYWKRRGHLSLNKKVSSHP